MKPETTLSCFILSLIITVLVTVSMVQHARRSAKAATKVDLFFYCTSNACCMFMVASLGALYFCKNDVSNGTFALVMAATIIYGAIMGPCCVKRMRFWRGASVAAPGTISPATKTTKKRSRH